MITLIQKCVCQAYRLALTFSVAHPLKGCNVSGKNLLKTYIKSDGVPELNSFKSRMRVKTSKYWCHSKRCCTASGRFHNWRRSWYYNEAVTMQSYIASYITRNLLKITKKSNCLQNIHLNAVDGQRLQINYILNKKNVWWTYLY